MYPVRGKPETTYLQEHLEVLAEQIRLGEVLIAEGGASKGGLILLQAEAKPGSRVAFCQAYLQ